MFKMLEFHKIVLKQIRWWAWAAIVLPLTSLAGMFFIEFFGVDTQYRLALTVGATTMFGIAVVWWWWALYIIARVTMILSATIDKIGDVDTDLKEIRRDIKIELDKLFKV